MSKKHNPLAGNVRGIPLDYRHLDKVELITKIWSVVPEYAFIGVGDPLCPEEKYSNVSFEAEIGIWKVEIERASIAGLKPFDISITAHCSGSSIPYDFRSVPLQAKSGSLTFYHYQIQDRQNFRHSQFVKRHEISVNVPFGNSDLLSSLLVGTSKNGNAVYLYTNLIGLVEDTEGPQLVNIKNKNMRTNKYEN